uniref:Uncharacterized protein n=1 Tax=Ditylenchus dipsaci TaxID=166011 RepID=A0A915DU66_9BILA
MCFEEVEKELEQLTKVRNDLEIEVNSSGECHAILYWFEFADSQLESANRLSMLGDVAGKASAYIVNESRFVQPGEKLKLQASLHHGTVIFHGSNL